MNDIFNLSRFGFLLKKTLFEHRLLLSGIFALSMFLTWLFYRASSNIGSPWIYSQIDTFGLGLIVGCGTLSAILFSYFSSHAKGYNYLTLPVSAFEKWLVGLFIVTIFTILYLVYFRMLDATLVMKYHNSLDPTKSSYQQYYNYAYVLAFDNKRLTYILNIYFSLTGFMAIAALYFNKNAVVKGALAFLGIYIGSIYGNQSIARWFLGNDTIDAMPYSYVLNSYVLNRLDYVKIMLPENYLQIIDPFFLIGLPVILWSVALLRLREKEF